MPRTVMREEIARVETLLFLGRSNVVGGCTWPSRVQSHSFISQVMEEEEEEVRSEDRDDR